MKTCVVLVGGQGTRLRPFTLNYPKPMLWVYDQPHLFNLLQQLSNAGFEHVILSLGYLHEAITTTVGDGSQFGLTVTYVLDSMTNPGTAGALRECLRATDAKTLLVLNGDIVTDLNLGDVWNYHLTHNAPITLATTPVTDPTRFGVVVSNKYNNVTQFLEKPDNPPTNEINAGVYVMDSYVFDDLPLGHSMLETDLFPCYALKRQIKVYHHEGYWLDIGKPAQYYQVFWDHLNHKVTMPSTVTKPALVAQADGWYGDIGAEFTLTNVMRVGLALAHNLKGRSLLIGYGQGCWSQEFAQLLYDTLSHRGVLTIPIKPSQTLADFQEVIRYNCCSDGLFVGAAGGDEAQQALRLFEPNGNSWASGKLQALITQANLITDLTT